MKDTPFEPHPVTDDTESLVSLAEIHAEVEALLDDSEDPLKKFEWLRITDTTEIEQPEPFLTINDEIIGTKGNIITISGASKSGKTAFTGILMAGAISRDGIIDGLEGVKIQPNVHGKAVIHIDTEQARHKHQSNLMTIFRRCGMTSCPDYYRSYNFRGLNLDEYTSKTEDICDAATKKYNGIHLIVIDGIADYIYDVNDPVHSNAIVKAFEELAIKYHALIIVIVHTNPGNDKERGHLGSQCQRKSESVLTVKTENDISFIEPKFLRMAGKGSIPLIQFMYDRSKGYHVGCGIRSDMMADKDQERVVLIRKVCGSVFGGQSSFSYKEAIERIMKITNKADVTAKNMFKEMKAHEMIEKGEDNRWRINSGDNIETG